MKKLLLPVAAAALCACAGAPARDRAAARAELLTAEGYAAFDQKDLSAGRNAAAAEALRGALRRAADLYTEAGEREGLASALENGAFRNPQAYVESYKIISEGPEGGLYRVEIRARVLAAKLAYDMRPQGAEAGRPVAALLVAETPEGSGFAAAFSAALARRAPAELRDYAFTRGGARPGGDEAALAAASAEGADLLFSASASAAAEGGGAGTGFFPSRAEALVKLYDVRTGRLLLEVSRQASAIDASLQASFSKAMAAAAELLAQEASARAEKAVQPEAVLRLRFSGIKRVETLEKLKAQLEKLDLRRLRLESYSDGRAVFAAVPRRADPQELASAVLRADALGLQLVGTGADGADFAAGW